MIDTNLEKQGGAHKKVFIMSPQMQSTVSRLLTNVWLGQGQSGKAEVEIEGGWRLMTYRDIPILPTSSCMPRGRMTTITTATGTAAGTVPGGTFYIALAPVTIDGEQMIGDVTTATGGGSIDVTFTPYPGVYNYKIYAGTTDIDLHLIGVVPAQTYDLAGTPVSEVAGFTITDPFDTAPLPKLLLIAPDGVLDGINTPTVSVKHFNDVPIDNATHTPGVDTPQNIMLLDLDKYQGLGKLPYTNTGGDRFNGLVTVVPMALTDDFISFLIRSYCALCPSFEMTSIVSRGWKVRDIV
jgi:hypothetical protein